MTRNVGIKRDDAGRPLGNGLHGIRVDRWQCDKRNPPLVVGGVRHCPDCGRQIAERYTVTDGRSFPPKYHRSHVGLWSTWTGC